MKWTLKMVVVSSVSLMLAAGCMVVGGSRAAPDDGSDDKSGGQPSARVQPAVQPSAAHGEEVFQANCASCHRSGMAGAPDLTEVTERMNRQRFIETVDQGPGAMPSWSHLTDRTKQSLWAFLDSGAVKDGAVAQTESAGGGCGCGGGGNNRGSCGCGGGSGSCGAVAQKKPEPKRPEPPSGGGGCGCGR